MRSCTEWHVFPAQSGCDSSCKKTCRCVSQPDIFCLCLVPAGSCNPHTSEVKDIEVGDSPVSYTRCTTDEEVPYFTTVCRGNVETEVLGEFTGVGKCKAIIAMKGRNACMADDEELKETVDICAWRAITAAAGDRESSALLVGTCPATLF